MRTAIVRRQFGVGGGVGKEIATNTRNLFLFVRSAHRPILPLSHRLCYLKNYGVLSVADINSEAYTVIYVLLDPQT